MASADDARPDDTTAEDDEAFQTLMGISAFGKQRGQNNVQKQIDQSKRREISTTAQTLLPDADNDSDLHARRDVASEHDDDDDDDGDDDDDDDDDDEDDEDEFPTSHEMILKTHDRAVTCASLDTSGARLVTGSQDCTLKFHDFANMTPTTIRAFKSIDPTSSQTSSNSETHPIHQVLFNPHSARLMLVIAAQPQARIVDRNGEVQSTFAKGDMYLRDMHHTKGHVSAITCGAWHPSDSGVCVTGGTDSTVRIWNLENPRTQRDVIVHKSKTAGSAGRTRITALAWGPENNAKSPLIAAGLDGTLVMWDGDGPYIRPAGLVNDAHTSGTWTSGIAISSDGRMFVSRGGDDTIKLWDLRNFKSAVKTITHDSTSDMYPSSTISYSPSSANILVGSKTGNLHILNSGNLSSELTTPVTPGHALITATWHPTLNQIVTGSSNAETHVLYSPTISSCGAKTVMSKAAKRRHIDDDPNLTMDTSLGVASENISASGEIPSMATYSSRHPTVGLTASGKSRDPRRPHVPVVTPFAQSTPDAGYVREHIALSSMRDEDPREALLKYADTAKSDPLFTNAWSKTQPKTIYAELSDDDEDAPDKKKVKK